MIRGEAQEVSLSYRVGDTVYLPRGEEGFIKGEITSIFLSPVTFEVELEVKDEVLGEYIREKLPCRCTDFSPVQTREYEMDPDVGSPSR